MATVYELQEQRAGLVAQERSILDTAEKAGRDLTAEERSQCDKLDNDIDSLGKTIDEKLADEKRREKLRATEESLRSQRTHTPTRVLAKGGDDERQIISIHEALNASRSRGASRKEALSEVLKQYNNSEFGLIREAVQRFIATGAHGMRPQERAALQMDVDASGGTLVMPEEFIARLIQGLDEAVVLRQICTVLPMISAESVGAPSLDTDPADADWTTELAIGSEDTSLSFGKRNLHPHPIGKLLKVSKTLLRRSAIPVDALVRERLTFKFAVTEEQAFMTGSGAERPLGLFTASASGINTDRDISTDNTTTNVTADGLINAKYNLASQYLMSANLRWVFHRLVVRNIRKLKDGEGQYLWVQGLGGTPDSLLDIPVVMSEYAPSTFTASSYVGLLGDFRWYWIAESLRFELQRLDELYAATNQVGFIGRAELDGMPVLSEAFSRVQLAAS